MRIQEIDFLKAVLIILMISFHLVYFEQLHPYAKQVVYTFHMPGFLLLSGFLMNIGKPWPKFLRTMMWLAIPYIIMESGYTVMASVLPINEHIDRLTAAVFLDKLLLHPLGPYWYLHTMVVCGLTYYAVFRLVPLKDLSRFILLAFLYYVYARWAGIVALGNAGYFLAGAVVQRSGLPFLSVFQPSALAIVAFALLAACPQLLDAASVGGILIVYMVFSSCLFVFPYVRGRLRSLFLFIGRNTLPLFLFSPLFTILCKQLVPYVAFDPTGLLFLLVALTVCTAGSLGVAYLMDVCRVSPLFFGRERVVSAGRRDGDGDTAKFQSC